MKDKALKLALEFLEQLGENHWGDRPDVIAAIEQALAQPAQEPVEGWVKIEEIREHFDSVGCGTIYKTAGEGRKPLYTAPPQREWVGLTGPEVDEAYRSVSDKEWAIGGLADARVFLCAIEAKLKELNHERRR